jgi:hypothetical protein
MGKSVNKRFFRDVLFIGNLEVDVLLVRKTSPAHRKNYPVGKKNYFI